MGKIYRSARPDRRNAGDVVSLTGSLVCRPWVSWLPRGIPLTAVHIVARALAIAVVEKPLSSSTWKVLAVAAVVLVALLWGGVDGIRDARANPTPTTTPT